MASVAQTAAVKELGICGWVARITANRADLLAQDRYFDGTVMESLRTNVFKIDRLPPGTAADSEIRIIDEPSRPTSVSHQPGAMEASGDFTTLEQVCPDPRYSIFGNLGLYFRFAMAEMEDKGMFSFHASGLYREEDNRLLMLVGGPGAGKTVFLLAGILLGYRVLSAEMIHVKVNEDEARFFKGALIDNVRVGTLTQDFPNVAEVVGIEIPETQDIWATKIAVDLTQVATRDDVLVNPHLDVVFPHVERGRGAPEIGPVRDPLVMGRLLFGNLSEKISQSFLLYDQYPVYSFDTPQRAARRFEFVQRLTPRVRSAKRVLTGPTECMKGV